jgi:hypothetical protein
VGEDASVFRLWWPLLLGLSTSVADNRSVVRINALETLRGILNKYVNLFSAQTWAVIFKGVLFPIVDTAKSDEVDGSSKQGWQSDKKNWIQTMAFNALSMCADLYLKLKDHDKVIPLLPDLLAMLEDCILQNNSILVTIAINVYRDLILNLCTADQRLREEHVDLLCKCLTQVLRRNLHAGAIRGDCSKIESCPESVIGTLLQTSTVC